VVSRARYQLFTTADVSPGSFLEKFEDFDADGEQRALDAGNALEMSSSELVERSKSNWRT
jgi:hypothetical protein